MKIRKSEIPEYDKYKQKFIFLLDNGYLHDDGEYYRLTEKGKLWTGSISYLFYSDTERARVQESFVNSLRYKKNPFNQDEMNINIEHER